MKGQISIIEAIISAIALFIAFNMMITTGEYQTKWKESLNSLQGIDILITADRSGKLHDYPFSTAFQTDFLNKILAIKDAVVKNEVQGTVKSTVYVACDCTPDQGTYIQNILNDVKFNTRQVTGVVCSTTLPAINNCGSGKTYPDALVIWGYKDLVSYTGVLTNFAQEGNGIIEIADLDSAQASNTAQQTIFGIKWISEGNFLAEPIQILKPRNSSIVTYQSYKWFYHSPYLLRGTESEDVPVEGVPLCGTSGMRNDFKFQDANHRFWICGTTSVYWDTSDNNVADLVVTPRNTFSIGNSNFFLNYIDTTDKIRVSFKPDYTLNDFLSAGNSKIFPSNDDKNRVLLAAGYWDAQKERPVSTLISNRFENALVAWLPDFGRNSGLPNTGDDHKQLLSSLIFSVANKQTKETFQQIGEITSYINVNNTDILEIYKIDLSIGKPF